MADKLPAALLKRIAEVTSKRPKTVLDRIVANGGISTDELKEIGYNHAPRAAADVRELGIKLKTTIVKNSTGGRMARYSFADEPLETNKQGRQQFPKKQRQELISDSNGRCDICSAENNLQIDHKIPYAIAGESDKKQVKPYQVLCGSCNRTKSWSCEHCENMKLRDPAVCRSCYWADQTDYEHVAMRPERRIDVVWVGKETVDFDTLRKQADANGRTAAEEIKSLLQRSKKR
jgi:hypothetical protein